MNTEEELKSAEQKVEEAHQRLLSIDQQYYRVQKLHQSEEVTIASLREIKTTLENRISILNQEIDKGQLTVEILIKNKEEITAYISSRVMDLKKDNEEIESKKKEQEERETVLSAKEIAIEVREHNLDKREKEVKGREEEVLEKQERITSFATSL